MTASTSKQTKTTSAMSPTSNITLPTVVLLIATLSVAAAFQHSGAIQSAKLNTLFVHDSQQAARPYSRNERTRIYTSRVQSLSSPTSLSRVRRKQQPSSTLTQLHFSDDSSSNAPLEPSWWRKLFTASQYSASRSSTVTGTSSTVGEDDEQDNVDAYLEFLDRRYRRLHCDDKKEVKAISNPKQDSSELKTAKPFSAMDWLMKGSGSNNSDDLTTTREQQEDALYVLGVAGLASQKLLQKHHLPTTMNQHTKGVSTSTIDKVVELKEQIDDAIEVNEVSINTSLKSEVNTLVLNNILLPIVRSLYLIQRQKDLFFRMIQEGVKAIATKATNGILSTFSQGPKSILDTLLSIGGGKRNFLRTIAVGYATIIVFRPLMHAIFAEGLAFDPLIQ
ncbi:unnamed protein product [Pseudo-nitzschia multistriata]|uniref:Uncharacterized protein n=1 Tax=Pseudo-nitzschia multistriata TaxID=183589 RepID=A0A448Z5Y8_9STRA|nr:unnamed protein product [Pseudo-nitzschia multistriata]